MTVTPVFDQLERLLPLISKPIQYVGGELGSVVKDWDSVAVRWALMYPDAYEVGLPNQGVQILYEVLNEQPDVLAERTYAVWPDLEKLMRSNGVPQFTVDAHRPVRAFDVFGLSFATELGYTNMLTAIDLAGIPLLARDRTDDDPVVLAGGHAAFNPEPIADFIDAAVLGDGEEAVGEITAIVRDWKAQGRPGGRDELLLRLARTEAVYVPRFYDVEYLPDGRIMRGRAEPGRRPVPDPQTHHNGPRPVAVPAQAARSARRDRARAVRGGDLPWLHPRLPLLPGRHDHPPRAGAVDHDGRPDGPRRSGVLRLLRGRPAVAVERRPQRDRRHVLRSGAAVRGHERVAVAAVDAGRRVQRDARPGAVAQRAPRPVSRSPPRAARSASVA